MGQGRRIISLAAVAVLLVGALPNMAGAAESNTPPVAVDDPGEGCGIPALGGMFPILEDPIEPMTLALTCAPLRNDYDLDGDVMIPELVSQPAHGTATIWGDEQGTFDFATYMPDPDFSTLPGDVPGGIWESDSFTYRVTDGQAWSNVASYGVWVAPINDPPTFTTGPNRVEVEQDSGPYSGQWAVDIDPGPNEADQQVQFEVTVDLNGLPDLFEVDPAIDANGVLTFTPGVHESGLADVTVRAVDDGGLEDYGESRMLSELPDDTSDPVTFEIVVRPNNPPEIGADADLPIAKGAGPTRLDLLANDSDPDGDALRIVSVTTPGHGTATVVEGGAAVTYDPDDAYTGVDWFQYTIEDARGGTATQYVTVLVAAPPNRAPTAVSDSGSVPQGAGPVTIAVLANDTDPDGDPLSIVSVTQGAHGTVAIGDAGGAVRYDPTDLYAGADTFTYTISDGRGGTAVGVVTVSVVRDSSAPTVGKLTRTIPAQTIGSSTVIVRYGWSGVDTGTGIARYQLERSVNGGTFRSVTLSSPTATAANATVGLGTSYRYRVRATDRAGNVGPWVYWATVTPTRYQETSSIAAYTGTWTRVTSTSLSGGSARYATSSTRRLRFTFTGRDVALIASHRTTGGRAQIRIDGVLVATIDLDSSATRYRRVVFAKGWSSKVRHTLEIRPVGDGRVEVDAIVVLR